MKRAFLLLLLLGVLASWNCLHAQQCPDGSAPPCRAPAARPTSSPSPTSVAVLYFDNLSPDTADAYLASGLTDEIIARLGQVQRLIVKSRTAVARYRGVSGDPATLGRALGVAHLLNGTVRRAGPRMRVTVELVKASTGDRLWGERFDRSEADLLDVQEEIAGAVATAIAGRLLPTERRSIAQRPTTSPPAYDRFLRGNHYLGERTQYAFIRAIGEYEAAARIDPTFVAALGRAAHVYGLLLNWQWEVPGVPRDSLLGHGFAAADRALAQDSGNSDVWMARAVLLSHRHRRSFEGVRAAFERALALDPRNAEAYSIAGHLLAVLGEDSLAGAALQHSLALEPERAVTLSLLAYQRLGEGQFVEAAHWLDSAVAVDPGAFYAYALRSVARLRLGDPAGVRRDAQAAQALGPPEYLAGSLALALAEVASGDTAAARARLERSLSAPVTRSTVWELWLVGIACLGVGRPEQALDYWERVPADARLGSVLRRPEFAALRGGPRFEQLLASVRAPEAPR